ncbi:MAG: YlxR family protein [Chloroflexi bacterium]|nr:YlxR family protein [Chloroflexota bacterium]
MAMKHIPQRTCIACRTVRSKRELARIVRTVDSHVQADLTGKKSGRGAYLCRQRECWQAVLDHPSRLGQALKLETPLSNEDLAHLREFATTLPSRSSETAAPKNETQ